LPCGLGVSAGGELRFELPASLVCSLFVFFKARLTSSLLQALLSIIGCLDLNRVAFDFDFSLGLGKVECCLSLLESPLSGERPRLLLLFVNVLLQVDLVTIEVV
jgi:hypothetical protein